MRILTGISTLTTLSPFAPHPPVVRPAQAAPALELLTILPPIWVPSVATSLSLRIGRLSRLTLPTGLI